MVVLDMFFFHLGDKKVVTARISQVVVLYSNDCKSSLPVRVSFAQDNHTSLQLLLLLQASTSVGEM